MNADPGAGGRSRVGSAPGGRGRRLARGGEPRQRENPLTGEPSDWQFSRPGHHCGVVTTTPNMMFFRSGFIGYYDLYEDSGTKHFAGQRLGCWINAIPSSGLVVIPEASAGCVCWRRASWS